MSLTLPADELIIAFENHDSEIRYFLDRQTGEILFVSDLIESEDDRGCIDEDRGRYVEIESESSHVGFEIMANFVESLPEGGAWRDLSSALNQRKPFRRFKDTLTPRIEWLSASAKRVTPRSSPFLFKTFDTSLVTLLSCLMQP